MLAAESDRRSPAIIAGIEEIAASSKGDPDRVEELRVEAHGLKGAALVVGEDRLAELAKLIELFFVARGKSGKIDPSDAATVIAAVSALNEGAAASAESVGEPSAVGESLKALSD